ncbi:MAG: ArsR family transcriptional regulator [Alphaproteobacteria bacterium]|nr:MAG: ArsR family transcriptional regulator [Alphaproteobacteria bacterium]
MTAEIPKTPAGERAGGMRQAGDPQPELCAERLRTVGEPTRLRILQLLQERQRTPAELRHALDLPANLLSHHLKVLRKAGFVTVRREGRLLHYHLVHPLAESEDGRMTIDLGCCRLDFS